MYKTPEGESFFLSVSYLGEHFICECSSDNSIADKFIFNFFLVNLPT